MIKSQEYVGNMYFIINSYYWRLYQIFSLNGHKMNKDEYMNMSGICIFPVRLEYMSLVVVLTILKLKKLVYLCNSVI